MNADNNAVPGAPGAQPQRSAANPSVPAAPAGPSSKPFGSPPIPPQPGVPASPAMTRPATPNPAAQPAGKTGPLRTSLRSGTQPTATPAAGKGAEPGAKKRGLKSLTGAISKKITALGPDAEPQQNKGGPRKVRVMLTAIDPISVMKLTFLLSLVAGIMLIVAVSVIWAILNGMGTLTAIQSQITDMFGSESKVDILKFFDFNKVMSATILVAVFNTVVFTALSAVGALIYNSVSSLMGGVYVTLTDD